MNQATRDGITLGVALLGASLGILNFWRMMDRDRVHIRVVPRSYFHTNGGASGVCIEIINLGFIPITISQVGFTVNLKGQVFLHRSLIQDLPKRLEARTSFTAYLATGVEQDERFRSVVRAFAKTECGRRFTGSSIALRSYIKAARTAKQPSP